MGQLPCKHCPTSMHVRSTSVTGAAQSARPICWSTRLQHSCQIMNTRFFCSAKGMSLVVLWKAAGCHHALDDNRLECSAELSGLRLLTHQLFTAAAFHPRAIPSVSGLDKQVVTTKCYKHCLCKHYLCQVSSMQPVCPLCAAPWIQSSALGSWAVCGSSGRFQPGRDMLAVGFGPRIT